MNVRQNRKEKIQLMVFLIWEWRAPSSMKMRKRIIKICRSQIDNKGADYWGFFESDVGWLCKSRTFPSTNGLSLWMNRLTFIRLGQNASLNTVWKCCSGIPNLKLTNSSVATSTPFLTKGLLNMVAVSTPSLFATYSHTESDFTCALNLPNEGIYCSAQLRVVHN